MRADNVSNVLSKFNTFIINTIQKQLPCYFVLPSLARACRSCLSY